MIVDATVDKHYIMLLISFDNLRLELQCPSFRVPGFVMSYLTAAVVAFCFNSPLISTVLFALLVGSLLDTSVTLQWPWTRMNGGAWNWFYSCRISQE